MCGPAGSETPAVFEAPVRSLSVSAAAAQGQSACSLPGGGGTQTASLSFKSSTVGFISAFRCT